MLCRTELCISLMIFYVNLRCYVRTQCIDKGDLTCGAPQGSTLGPLKLI